MHALGERIEFFHEHVHDALEDVARRSDVEGLRLIEAHVVELGHKLVDVQAPAGPPRQYRNGPALGDGRGVGRASRAPSAITRMCSPTSSTRQRPGPRKSCMRMAEANAVTAIDGGRFEELRGLIERHRSAAPCRGKRSERRIARQRDGHRQADGLSELKALVETSMGERRKGEQEALSMLDTVQQALVEVLDRIDALEGKRAPEPAKAEEPAFTELPIAPDAISGCGCRPGACVPTSWIGPAGQAARRRTRPGMGYSADRSRDPARALSKTKDDEEDDDTLSPVERMRRDFIADAQRAKLKAASNWAQGIKGEAPNSRKPSRLRYWRRHRYRAPRQVLRRLAKSPGGSARLHRRHQRRPLLLARKSTAPPIAIESARGTLSPHSRIGSLRARRPEQSAATLSHLPLRSPVHTVTTRSPIRQNAPKAGNEMDTGSNQADPSDDEDVPRGHRPRSPREALAVDVLPVGASGGDERSPRSISSRCLPTLSERIELPGGAFDAGCHDDARGWAHGCRLLRRPETAEDR